MLYLYTKTSFSSSVNNKTVRSSSIEKKMFSLTENSFLRRKWIVLFK